MIGYEVLLDPLGHAPYHAYDKAALLATFATDGIEGLKAPQHFLFGVVTDRAGVEKHRIGIVQVVGGGISRHFHYRCNNLGIGHIHLASVGFYIHSFVGYICA